MHVATTYLAAGGGAGDDESSKMVPATRHQVVIHLDRDLLRAGEELPAVAASLDDGTPVSAEALRRIACDAGLVAAVISEPSQSSQSRPAPVATTSQILDIGRRTRAIPTAIRRALWLRDRACRFPGCTNHRCLHGHHVRHWLHGGATSLNNLVLLCPFHHRQVHEGGFNLALESSGEVAVRGPGGADLGRRHALPAAVREDDDLVVWMTDWMRPGEKPIDAWTATSSWDGDPVDYGAAIDAMLE